MAHAMPTCVSVLLFPSPCAFRLLFNSFYRWGNDGAPGRLGDRCEMNFCNITDGFFSEGIISGIIFFAQFGFNWSYPIMLMMVALPLRLYVLLLIVPLISMLYTLFEALAVSDSHFRYA